MRRADVAVLASLAEGLPALERAKIVGDILEQLVEVVRPLGDANLRSAIVRAVGAAAATEGRIQRWGSEPQPMLTAAL